MRLYKSILAASILLFLLLATSIPGSFALASFAQSAPSSFVPGPVIDLSNDTRSAETPVIAQYGNNTYVVWSEKPLGQHTETLFRASQDKGHSFGSILNISNDNGTSFEPKIAVSTTNVYIVWRDNTPGNFHIYFKASHVNGTKFKPVIDLSNHPSVQTGVSIGPVLAATGRHVYVAWSLKTSTSQDIFFSASHNNGSSFKLPIDLSNGTGQAIGADIVSSANHVFVTWDSVVGKNHEAFFTVSRDNGTTFSSPFNVSNNTGISLEPVLAVFRNSVYVVWRDNKPGNYDIFFRASHDFGATFGTVVNLSNDPGLSSEATVSAIGSYVYVTWRDDTTGNNQIYFTSSSDNGTNFGLPRNLSLDTGSSGSNTTGPQMAVFGSKLYIVWPDNTPGSYEVYLSASADNGTTFSLPVNLSNNPGDSGSRGLGSVAFGRSAAVTWVDNSTGKDQIFFSVGLQ